MSIIYHGFHGTAATMLEETSRPVINAFTDYVLGVVMLQSAEYNTVQPLANASIAILARNRICASAQSNAKGEYLMTLSRSTPRIRQCINTNLKIWIRATCNFSPTGYALVEAAQDFVNVSVERVSEGNQRTLSPLLWYHPIILGESAITCLNCSQSLNVTTTRIMLGLPTKSQKGIYFISFGLYALLFLFLIRKALGHSHDRTMHARCQNEHFLDSVDPGSIQIKYTNQKCTRRTSGKHQTRRLPETARTRYFEARLHYQQCVTTTLTDEML
uniref:AlNc14C10G1270 protein n=1 Tax=Albugo laibachii Nc14 TaxID=890382 RepID=F0W2M3_9STRA|nr:AlNc14C10G1270 [Albugo laibachii Nc14]|eukprot:CCA15309.1 AlNc14C10G1270 [Albugo laibachii Nc14]